MAADDMLISFERTGLVLLMQLALDVSLHFTTSPSEGEKSNVGLAEGNPEFIPLTCHWYAGVVPPFTGDAVKDTEFPWQYGLVSVLILTLADNDVLTDILTGAEMAGLPLTHAALDVSLQVTISPFCGVKLNMLLFAPVFTPFTFH
jgi:hypothetical protein